VIVAYTDYDCVSCVLAGAARAFVRKAAKYVTQELCPPTKSLAASIATAIQQTQAPLFFFGHGRQIPPGLIGQDRVPAIGGSHGPFVANRFVVGVSCYSYQVLSALMPARQAPALGFKGLLAVPVIDPYRKYLQACILEGLQSLLDGEPVEVARKKMKAAFQEVVWHLQGTQASDLQQVFELVSAVSGFKMNVTATDHMGDGNRGLF
jgi:hypothetical protein